MNFSAAYALHCGDVEWTRRDLYEWLTDLFEAPEIPIGAGCTGRIRAHLQTELTNGGWSYNVRIDPTVDLTVTGRFRDLAFQIQTGNISRAVYDLVKLAVPTKTAADLIASNVAHVDRIWKEVQLFDRIFTMPLLLISFE
jgi:hypothetical protein